MGFYLYPVAGIEGITVPPLPLFPGPYSVPPGFTSITLEKVSKATKRCFFVRLTGLLNGVHAFWSV